MSTKQLAIFFRRIAFLVLGGPCLLAAGIAQSVYENYTFTTLAGVPESGAGSYDGAGVAASFNYPRSSAVDSSGNLYVADLNNHTIRKITPAGVVMTVAGLAGSPGSADSTGSAARFNSPYGVAVDSGGNVYVVDTGDHTIRKITPAGAVTTLAGSAGIVGSANGIGGAARFNDPQSVAVDSGGNLYVTDTENKTIRKVTPAGMVTTLAGSSGKAGSANGTGSTARFFFPTGVAVDSGGNVFVADTGNHTIRKITSAGVVTTLAGSVGNSGSENGTGSAARFYSPFGVAVDSSGTVFVADTYNQTIRVITPAGEVTTRAGLATTTGSENGTGSAARFNYPTGVAVGNGDHLYVADYSNQSIREVSPAGEVTTLAGKAVSAGSANGTAGAARFNFPAGIALDAGTNAYVADVVNHVIRLIASGGMVTTLAGMAGSIGSADGAGSAAGFNSPGGATVGGDGNIYVADSFNHTIRKITPGGVVTTLAGSAGNLGSADGTGSAARFFGPFGIAAGSGGDVYAADTLNHTIRRITSEGVVTTLAGMTGLAGSVDGMGSVARFNFPSAVAVGQDGNLWIADRGNNTIRKITPDGTVTTLAGSPGSSGSADGTGSVARFNSIFGLAVDSSGNIYATDLDNHTIRKITAGGTVTTLAGMVGTSGSADGTGRAARFNGPEGVAIDGNGNIYVSDGSNHTIRKGYPALPDSPLVDLPVGAVGVARHLDVTNSTTTSWSWSIVRRPAASTAQLSSTTIRNPTFTPDVPDLYVFRFQGWDNLGRVAIGTVSIVADATPPVLSIASPVSGQRWSNTLFTVTGSASDDEGVFNVQYQINGGDWSNAVGTTAWTGTVKLAAGTNTIRAYAVDTSGNLSVTQSVSFIGVLSDRLTVMTQGKGTLSPNYSNALLVIGKPYTMTATAGAGFTFNNWAGGTSQPLTTLTNAKTVQFVMQSNLTLQANFTDVARPAILFTAPTSGQRLSNALLMVRGTAKDNALVTNVYYSLNGSPFQSANGTTNWSAEVSMTAGTNVIVAKAVDNSGLESLSVTSRCLYVITSPLTLLSNGLGTITRSFSGVTLEVGRSYKVTAVPGRGYVFSNWIDNVIGNVASTNAALNFVMQSNLVLQANFVPNPFIPVKGTYSGLFYDTNGVQHGSSGLITLTLTDRGTYTGSLQTGPKRLALSGKMSIEGIASQMVLRPGSNALSLTLFLDLTPGSDRLTGVISDGQWMAELAADRAVFNALTNRATQYAGKYTMVIPGSDDTSEPAGDSYGTVTVDFAGKVALSGALADGTAFSQTTTLSKRGQWPLYVPLYGGAGSILSWITFTNRPADDLHGDLNWFKPALPTAKFYRAGFTIETEAMGSRYQFTKGVPVLNFSTGQVWFAKGNLPMDFTNQVVLKTNNTVLNLSANGLTLSLTTLSGLFGGSVVNPTTGKTIPFKGVVLQKQEVGSGSFFGTNQSGRVLWAPE